MNATNHSSQVRSGRKILPGKLTIKTTHKKRLREYFYSVSISSSDFDRRTWEWIAPMLAIWSRESEVEPKPAGTVDQLLSGLAIATRLPAWKELTQSEPKDVKPRQVTAFFAALDSQLSCIPNQSTYMNSRLSQEVRRFIREYLERESIDPLVARSAEQYRSPISQKTRPRSLISDIPNHLSHPISAIPHNDIGDLKEKTGKLLVDDLNQVRDICHGILKNFELAIAQLNKYRSREIPKEEEYLLRQLLAEPITGLQDPINLGPERLEYLLALTVQIASGTKDPLVTSSPSTQGRLFRNSSKLFPILKQKLNGFSNGCAITQLVQIEVAPPLEVLLACGLILQCHTGWNFSSVLSIPRDQIDITNLPHDFQSVKSKTGDHTPFVVIERSDQAVVDACNYLVRRLDLMKKMGKVKENEQRVFLNPMLMLDKRYGGEVVAGWDGVLSNLRKRHGLKKFSFDQLRTQKLSALRYGSRGIDGAQLAAGHSNVATTGEYIDQLINRRLNSSINIEFQRRLDNTIRYMITPHEIEESERLIAYPIGDGASCAAPTEPPDASWMSNGLCTATNCHTQNGCQHRRLLVTEERIEEVVRTKDFYVQEWTRLINENHDAFEKIHYPAMVFNFAFFGALSRGPYRHLVRKYENEITPNSR